MHEEGRARPASYNDVDTFYYDFFEKDQQVIVEGDTAHQQEQRARKEDRGRRPEPGAGVIGLQPLRPGPEDRGIADQCRPGEDAQAEEVPAEDRAHQAQ